MMDVSKVYAGGSSAWDIAVHDASEEYKHRMVDCFLFFVANKLHNINKINTF